MDGAYWIVQHVLDMHLTIYIPKIKRFTFQFHFLDQDSQWSSRWPQLSSHAVLRRNIPTSAGIFQNPFFPRGGWVRHQHYRGKQWSWRRRKGRRSMGWATSSTPSRRRIWTTPPQDEECDRLLPTFSSSSIIYCLRFLLRKF